MGLHDFLIVQSGSKNYHTLHQNATYVFLLTNTKLANMWLFGPLCRGGYDIFCHLAVTERNQVQIKRAIAQMNAYGDQILIRMLLSKFNYT